MSDPHREQIAAPTAPEGDAPAEPRAAARPVAAGVEGGADETRESLTGRMWVAAAAILTIAIPIWMLLTAIIIQLSPSLSGFDAVMDGASEVRHVPVLSAWLRGGIQAAVIMIVVAPLIALMLGGLRAASAFGGRRARADRARYDALVQDAAVLTDADWAEEPGSAADTGAPVAAPGAQPEGDREGAEPSPRSPGR